MSTGSSKVSEDMTVDNEHEKNHHDRDKRKVVVQQHGSCDEVNPSEWPCGAFLSSLCRTFEELQIESGISDQRRSVDHRTTMPEIWQASARRAMLEKFGFFLNHVDDDERKSSDLTFLPGEIGAVQRTWKNVVDKIVDEGIGRSGNNEHISYWLDDNDDQQKLQQEIYSNRQDFVDFILGRCCKSNTRQLQWSVMSCPRGVQFPLHAHPNLELIYCIRGELFEIRMCGEPITRTFEKSLTGNDSETHMNVIGPNLSSTKRLWSFGTLKAGQWLVNEIGSVHKSFTSVRSDGGCDLLVLWGGSHANILHPPITPNIQKVVDEISCCRSVNNHIIPETFVPDSER